MEEDKSFIVCINIGWGKIIEDFCNEKIKILFKNPAKFSVFWPLLGVSVKMHLNHYLLSKNRQNILKEYTYRYDYESHGVVFKWTTAQWKRDLTYNPKSKVKKRKKKIPLWKITRVLPVETIGYIN